MSGNTRRPINTGRRLTVVPNDHEPWPKLDAGTPAPAEMSFDQEVAARLIAVNESTIRLLEDANGALQSLLSRQGEPRVGRLRFRGLLRRGLVGHDTPATGPAAL